MITHAHADHARRGSKIYYCEKSGVSLLRSRVGKNICVRSFEYGEKFELNGVELSFHPAGHILGSSQVRMSNGAEVWVASGDYKREPDPTCEPFEVVKCDVFVTEATFGTPAFCWEKSVDVGREIADWWHQNSARGVNSVLFAYSLGKAQRVLGSLLPYARKPVYCHPAVTELNACYRAEGIALAETICLSRTIERDTSERRPGERQPLAGELFLVPQAFLKSDQAQILGDNFETAFASGWMAQNAYGYDRGFVMSDHADWNDLVRTIIETGAQRVYVQHRNGALVRHLRGLGLFAFSEEELTPSNPDQLQLF